MNTSNPHKRLISYLAIFTLAMFAFAFAMVPIYNSLCKALGINGKTNRQPVAYNSANHWVDQSRVVTVEFIAQNNGQFAWQFQPNKNKVTVHPGEMKRIAYFASNDSPKTMTVQAIPSVTPGLAARYLKKTECFCFEKQTLDSKKSIQMPLLFHIDPELPKNINTITLSYTLFDVTDKQSAGPETTDKIL